MPPRSPGPINTVTGVGLVVKLTDKCVMSTHLAPLVPENMLALGSPPTFGDLNGNPPVEGNSPSCEGSTLERSRARTHTHTHTHTYTHAHACTSR